MSKVEENMRYLWKCLIFDMIRFKADLYKYHNDLLSALLPVSSVYYRKPFWKREALVFASSTVSCGNIEASLKNPVSKTARFKAALYENYIQLLDAPVSVSSLYHREPISQIMSYRLSQ